MRLSHMRTTGETISFAVGTSASANYKWGFLTASVAGSYLFENTKSLTTLLEANFYIMHMNGFYQYTAAESKTMNIFSINGGISIPLQSVLLNFFCGFFYYDYIGEPALFLRRKHENIPARESLP